MHSVVDMKAAVFHAQVTRPRRLPSVGRSSLPDGRIHQITASDSNEFAGLDVCPQAATIKIELRKIETTIAQICMDSRFCSNNMRGAVAIGAVPYC